jgi:hypothetical protein
VRQDSRIHGQVLNEVNEQLKAKGEKEILPGNLQRSFTGRKDQDTFFIGNVH